MLQALILYLYYTALDGDWANDWLTHMPEGLQPTVQALGQLLAATMGLAACADPTMPANWLPALLPAYQLLARLYDALLAVGVC
jgi:hypothetical protein